ncbi:hypothetical protein VH567_12190 [Sphingomonas sp. 4RDLI-65]|uniref:hypothetical protein n=1 Tax=Sphingomonas sp. 4RDLI-65 TaxID=3111641 RepID=UPI003C20E9CC
MALLMAGLAAPSCTAPIGEPVAVSSTPLSIEALGGSYRATPGWPAPGEARIDQLRFDWGLMLRSNDPRFANFDLTPGAVHSRSSGCWFELDSAYAKDGVENISASRIANSGYREGFVPLRPDVTPDIAGYRFAAADGNIHRDGFTWIGVWNADGSAERSQVVAFDGARYEVLATLPVRLGAIAQLPDLHSQAYHLTFVGEGKPGRPVPWMRLIWF